MNTNMKVKQQLLNFCKHSSIHGMYYFYRSKNWFDRILWTSALLLCSCLALILSQRLWLEYKSDPLITAVQNAYYPVKNIPFPSIVVCSNTLFRFDSPWADEVKKTIKSHGFSEELSKEFFSSLLNPTVIMPHQKEVTLIYNILYNAGLHKSYTETVKNIQRPCNQLMLQCIWRSTIYNCTQMFYAVYTRSGLCCRFDLDYLKANVPEDTNLKIRNIPEKSLKVVLNGEYIGPDGKSVDSLTRIYIVGNKEHVSILHNSVYLVPGNYYDITLSVHEIIASEYVKKLSKSIRKCNLPEIDHVPNYKTCVTNIYRDYLKENCKCLPVFLSDDDTKLRHRNCSWEQYGCIATFDHKFVSDILSDPSSLACERPCEDVVYSPHFTYTKATRSRAPAYNTSDDWFNSGERRLEITVRFKSLSCFRYIQQAIFTWDQMLANLGGTFSLFIGGSIISAIEIVWISAHIIVTFSKDILKKIRNKETPRNELRHTNAWGKNDVPAINGVPFKH